MHTKYAFLKAGICAKIFYKFQSTINVVYKMRFRLVALRGWAAVSTVTGSTGSLINL